MYACRLHSELRMKRLKKEGWKWRGGEKHLDDFWNGRERGKSKKCKVKDEGKVRKRESTKMTDGSAPKELKQIETSVIK
jgi:hypothetical protein